METRTATLALPFVLSLVLAACTGRPPPDAGLRPLVRGVPLFGIHGLDFDAAGKLFVGSVVGESIFRIDVATGEASLAVGPPEGTADDLAFGPPGTPYAGWMVWTHIYAGEIWGRSPDGARLVILGKERSLGRVRRRIGEWFGQ